MPPSFLFTLLASFVETLSCLSGDVVRCQAMQVRSRFLQHEKMEEGFAVEGDLFVRGPIA
jgi:hypothetical protein